MITGLQACPASYRAAPQSYFRGDVTALVVLATVDVVDCTAWVTGAAAEAAAAGAGTEAGAGAEARG